MKRFTIHRTVTFYVTPSHTSHSALLPRWRTPPLDPWLSVPENGVASPQTSPSVTSRGFYVDVSTVRASQVRGTRSRGVSDSSAPGRSYATGRAGSGPRVRTRRGGGRVGRGPRLRARGVGRAGSGPRVRARGRGRAGRGLRMRARGSGRPGSGPRVGAGVGRVGTRVDAETSTSVIAGHFTRPVCVFDGSCVHGGKDVVAPARLRGRPSGPAVGARGAPGTGRGVPAPACTGGSPPSF